MQVSGNRQPLSVLIDLNVGQNRTGVEPGEAALELARQVAKLKHLHLIGVQGYEGHLQHIHDPAERESLCRSAMAQLTSTAQQLKEAGFSIEIVTTGGTGTAEICAACEGVTEVQPGSFIFMDTDYRNALGSTAPYTNALTILSTVLSRPTERRAVIDAGLKSLSTDSGMAEPKDYPGLRYRPGGDEHGILEWDEGQTGPEIGDRLEMIPSHIDTTVNLYDYYYACRKGKLEAIWSVAARGQVQ
jgi:D-serine deaminase-like pyridoxal phosphate-dependent protein